jgi:hypothetical protein
MQTPGGWRGLILFSPDVNSSFKTDTNTVVHFTFPLSEISQAE